MTTKEDFDRLESKINSIIYFFNIGKKPGRSKKEIDAWGDQTLLDIEKFWTGHTHRTEITRSPQINFSSKTKS